jgi:hypothetical protein
MLKDKVSGACSTHGENGKLIYFSRKFQGKEYLRDQDADERIILHWISNVMRVCTG